MELVSSSPKSRAISPLAELHPTAQTLFQKIKLLSWYLITLKLRETIYARQKGLPILSPKSGSSNRPRQQQFAPLGVLVNRNFRNCEIESHDPEDAQVIKVEEKLQSASQYYAAISREDVIVYRVPDYLKGPSRTEDYYAPRVVSIGPYHRGTAPLQKMERHKWLFLQHFINRTGKGVKHYLNSMKTLEPIARACYEAEFELSSDQFVEMMLLDGCFILEILNGFAVKSDPIFPLQGTIRYIKRDMALLENQIPLFVLDILLGLPSENPGGKRGALEIADKFFDNLMPSMRKATKGIHCLDVVREKFLNGRPKPHVEDGPRQKLSNCAAELRNAAICMLPKGIHVARKSFFIENSKVEREDGRHAEHVPLVEDVPGKLLNYCATELRNAGIKLRKVEHDESLLSIEFKNGTLYIPQISIDDGFKSLFSNLIAFEQCHLDNREQHITSYVVFLDALIDSPEDVRYLKNHKIIKNCLGSDAEVADIINSLCVGAVFTIEDSSLSDISTRINEYRNKTWNIWQATLKERYFNNPWTIISFVAGVLLLIMTAAQTLYTVYSYYRPNN